MLYVKMDQPVSRVNTAEWKQMYPQLKYSTQAVYPCLDARGDKHEFPLRSREWIEWIYWINRKQNPQKIMKVGYAPVRSVTCGKKGRAIKATYMSAAHSGDLVTLEAVEGKRGRVRALNINNAPPNWDFDNIPPEFAGCIQVVSLTTKFNTLAPPPQGNLLYPLLSDGTPVYLSLDQLEPFPSIPDGGLPVTVDGIATQGPLRIRSGPDTACEILASAEPGKEILIRDFVPQRNNIWARVTSDGVEGYAAVIWHEHVADRLPVYYTSLKMQTPAAPIV